MDVRKLLSDPAYRFGVFTKLGFYTNMDDADYLRKLWKVRGVLNLENPQTFNEKIQWLKMHDRKPEYTIMVDKYASKKYVASLIGEEHIIPTLGVWNSFGEIDFNTLPNQFVLKVTHDSGGLIICRDKEQLDIDVAKKRIEKALKNDYYAGSREWPYKDVPRRIIAEQFMSNGDSANGLIDYKFYCFNGDPKFLYMSEGLENHSTARISFLTLDWQFAEFGRSDYKPFAELPEKPEKFDEMLEIAEVLARNVKNLIRVDLYEIKGSVYFSELTFSPCSGMMPFQPEEWDKKVGDMLVLYKD